MEMVGVCSSCSLRRFTKDLLIFYIHVIKFKINNILNIFSTITIYLFTTFTIIIIYFLIFYYFILYFLNYFYYHYCSFFYYYLAGRRLSRKC